MSETLILKVDAKAPEKNKIEQAAGILREGGLVAFPTETVYGLGANALDQTAVAKIFEAKGRPGDNPLIVHIAELEQVYQLAAEVPLNARRAMEAFWPGPLTLVLSSKKTVPSVVTGGLDTIAVRMPRHPVALEILKAAGIPVAAPSANSSGKPSPTEAAHVLEDLAGKIDAVVDGGSAEVGLESTVVDMTGEPPVILRPGGIVQEQLEALFGRLEVDKGVVSDGESPRSPGMKYRHYSPKAQLVLVKGEEGSCLAMMKALVREHKEQGDRVAVLGSTELVTNFSDTDCICGDLGSRDRLSEIAANLFRVMRFLDLQDPNIIIAESFSDEGVGRAVMNRLSKAASQTVVAE